MHTAHRAIAAAIVVLSLGPTPRAPGRSAARHRSDQPAIANDNRTPAGAYHGDTLVLHLVAGPADWHILGDSEPAFSVFAFGEEGKQLTIPGPLIRVKVGTPVHVTLRNAVGDTLIVRGLRDPGGARDSLVVAPEAVGEVRFTAGHQGTYFYWGTTAGAPRKFSRGEELRNGIPIRPGGDSQLSAALVVDPAGPVAGDRILVITGLADVKLVPNQPARNRDRHGTPLREFMALNGKAWPHTERFAYAVGDTVRWRIVNASFLPHPMHLHGFFFRVDSHWARRAGADSIYSVEQRRMAVTEPIGVDQSVSIVWSPERAGGWIFHCHFTQHAAKLPAIDQPDSLEYPTTHRHGDPDQHFLTGMNGLITAITVTGRASSAAWRPARRLRLFVQSDSATGDSTRRFGYVLQRGGAAPRRDSVEYPGPLLVLTRGEPTSIDVVNHSGEPTAVHWHGIELESYYDGVVGWGGTRVMPGGTTRAIRPESTFEVRITPKRSGTFMYHTHLDEMRQQYGGLVGPIVVLEPGERFDPSRDLIFFVSDGVPQRVYINGSLSPPPKELTVGTTYRIRIANLSVYRPSSWTWLREDSSFVTWRPVAKDGFTLSRPQATARPSIVQISSGEAADFEFTPAHVGDLVLEVGIRPEGRPVQVQGTVRLHATTKAVPAP